MLFEILEAGKTEGDSRALVFTNGLLKKQFENSVLFCEREKTRSMPEDSFADERTKSFDAQ